MRLKSSFVVMHLVLCYTEFPVAVSSAFMFFSKQFNAYSYSTLMRLKSCFVVMHLVLCYTELPVAVSSAFMFFSKQFNGYS